MKALRYHARRPTGKTRIAATKPCDSAADLALAYPNQVNNVLAFLSIFRGPLDVRATRIDEEMKLAACRAIAALARESTSFGRNDIMPMPLDSNGLPRVAAAVAGAAVRTGAASRVVKDLAAYADAVATRVRLAREERTDLAPAEAEA